MDFQLVWTESAIEDLGAIVRYLAAQNSPAVAREIGFGIYDRVQMLAKFPEAGAVLPEKDDPRWRKLIYRSWKIAYRIDAEIRGVYIVRIWHASRGEVEIE